MDSTELCKPSVMILVNQIAHFPEMYRLSKMLCNQGNFDPCILFSDAEDFTQQKKICEAANVQHRGCFSSRIFKAPPSEEDRIRSGERFDLVRSFESQVTIFARRVCFHWAFRWAFAPLRRAYVDIFVTKISLIRLVWHLREVRANKRVLHDIFERDVPALLIFPNIDAGGFLQVMLRDAKKRGIPTLVVPYAWITRAEMLAAIHAKRAFDASCILNNLVGRFYKKWLYKGYLARPAVEIVAAEWEGCSPSDPWMPDSEADCIALESIAMLDSYVRDGVGAAKCKITGSASLDVLAINGHIQRNTILARVGIAKADHSKTLVLSLLPPDQTGNQLQELEHGSYRSMISFWIKELIRPNDVNVIFSLHPRMGGMANSIQSEFPGIHLYLGDACEVIPHADFCVGTTSGMLRYVVASGVPLLYYDVFGYRLREYKRQSAVVVVEESSDFVKVYSRLVVDLPYLESMKAIAKMDANNWGEIDGGAIRRIECLLGEMIDRH